MSAETGQACRIGSRSEALAFRSGAWPHERDIEQLIFTLDESLDSTAFAAAWQALWKRHAVLRDNPGATDDGSLDLQMLDWCHEPDDTGDRLEQFLRAQRTFDAAQPPSFRVALIRQHAGSWRVVCALRRGLLDWRSLSALLRELFAHYTVLRDGGASDFIPASIVAGRHAIVPEPADADTGYWTAVLDGFTAPNRLDVAAGPDAVAQTAVTRPLEHRLDLAQSDSVRRLCRNAGVTLNNAAEAAFALLLSHYCHATDIVFGILRSSRRSHPPGFEDALGSFTNVLPLRAKIPADSRVFELLWQLRDRHRDMRAHEAAGLEAITQCAAVEGGAGLFDAVLEFDVRDPAIMLGEILGEPSAEGAGRSRRPHDFRHVASGLAGLHVQVYGEREIVLRLKYRDGVLDAATAGRLLRHYGNLLLAMAREPWVYARDLDYLDARDKLPVRWPGEGNSRAPDRTRSLHGSFENRAVLHPHAVAVACGARQMTYAELNSAANRLAHRLRKAGATADRVIGLCAERSIEQIIGILGILKSGAAYLPLDPAYPRDRLAFLAGDAGIDMAVAPAALRDLLPDGKLKVIDAFIPGGAEDEDNPRTAFDADSLAYIIYTSGSTGQPKGVMVSHHNVVRLFDACASWLNAGADDVWTMFHSFAFDFSVWEIWGALLHGGRLEIVPRDVARSPDAFHALIEQRGVTVLSQTPSAFRQLMRADADRPRDLAALRLIVFGGEKLDPGSLRDWMQRHGDETPQLINMYGITETTVHVTFRPLTKDDAGRAGQSLIGWPLPDLYVRLLDADGRIVPPGVRGEICVGGAGVARGYLNRPQLNAAKFIRDPYSGNPDARLYRSGDIARQMPDGELCYLGRGDDEVKIRGFRIDLGEITAALRSLPGVGDAIVISHDTRDGEKRLIAYYTAATAADAGAQGDDDGDGSRGSPDLSELRLREALRLRLPEHMLPAMFIRLPAIPVNANNKTDFRALPDPSTVHSGVARMIDIPVTAKETLLARIWSDVLERRDIGRTDDFFGLGGDSVLALKVVAGARAAGLDISPRDIFEHSGLDELAQVARQASTTDPEEEADVNMDGPLPLTPIQHWFFEQAFDNPQHINQAFLFRIPPDTDVDILERACNYVIRHHDALRVRFTTDSHGRWQAHAVDAGDALEFSRIELDHLDASERREAVALIAGEIRRSLSISAGLLVRIAHFTGGLEDGDRLLIAIHRLAVDARSWAIILQDIDAVYRAIAAGREPVLTARTVLHAQWAAQLSSYAASQAVAGERAYWEKVVSTASDLPPAAMMNANAAGGGDETRLCTVMLETPETSALLGDVHHAYGTEVQELLIAGLSRAFADQWPAGRCLRIDVRERGREHMPEHIDVSRTAGWFDMLHPVVLDQNMTRNPARLICDVKTRLRTAPHHGLGWGLLRYLRSQRPVQNRRAASAPVLFTYAGNFERLLNTGMFQHAGDENGALPEAEQWLPYPLAVSAAIRDDRMEIDFRFRPSVISGHDVEALAQKYINALKLLVRHCRTRNGIARTPVDFPLAKLAQEELDSFPVNLENAEDILPLSPIQRLYHALSGTDRDIGLDQWVFRLEGRIDETAFESAWQELLNRHDALRTIFVDEGLVLPHQVVLRSVNFRLQRTDWRLLDANAQQRRLEEFLTADRRQGFPMNVAPLTRVTLIRVAEREWILVWTHHMAQVDGWSWPIIAAELGEIHDARLAGRRPALPQPGSYRSYIAWLMDRDASEYADFWQHCLARATRTLITRSRRREDRNIGPRDIGHAQIELSEALTEAVVQVARSLRLTPSVVFQGAWALLLAALTRRFNVTLGVAFSGRTAGIPAAEHTVGSFVNDLPVQVHVAPTARADHWLAGLRSLQADLNHYQNVSPMEVHEWSGISPGTRLFDTLIVFQNYATGEAARHWGDNIRVKHFTPGALTNYPLTIAITPGRRYRIDLFHDRKAIGDDAVAALGSDLRSILEAIGRSPDARLSTILNRFFGAGEPPAAAAAEAVAPAGGWKRRAGDRAGEPAVAERPRQTSQRATREHTETQEAVAAICREVLGVETLGAERNFFDIGAQSVSLIEIHERIQAALQRSFPIVKLFQYPTVAALSRYLDSGDRVQGLRDASRRAALVQRRHAGGKPGQQSRQPGRFDDQS